MKVLTYDKKTLFLKLRVETASDVWRLSRLLLEGDSVGAFTNRRDPEAPIDTPEAQRHRRPVFLSIRVEKIEFHEFTGHLRLTGPIVEGPFDIGRHHTLDIETGTDVSITKPQITGSDWAIIDEGKKGSDDPVLVVACVDSSEGAIVRIRGRSRETVQEMTRRGTGKYSGTAGKRQKDDEEYIGSIIAILEREAQNANGLVIAGPGFCKESVMKVWKETKRKGPQPTLASTSEAGVAGINELLRSGLATKALDGYVVAEEAKQVERLVGALGKSGLGAVGPAECVRAADAGAIEVLLVLDTHLRNSDVSTAIDLVKAQGGKVLIVRHDGEPGKRLGGLGGVSALLRYPVRLT